MAKPLGRPFLELLKHSFSINPQMSCQALKWAVPCHPRQWHLFKSHLDSCP